MLPIARILILSLLFNKVVGFLPLLFLASFMSRNASFSD